MSRRRHRDPPLSVNRLRPALPVTPLERLFGRADGDAPDGGIGLVFHDDRDVISFDGKGNEVLLGPCYSLRTDGDEVYALMRAVATGERGWVLLATREASGFRIHLDRIRSSEKPLLRRHLSVARWALSRAVTNRLIEKQTSKAKEGVETE